VLCFIFYPHETKHHLNLPLWFTSVNPRVSWSRKQITPSRGLVTLVRISFSPPHSCFWGGRMGIWLTQSVFYLLEWSGFVVAGIESGNPDLSLCCSNWYLVRFMVAYGASGVNWNTRHSLHSLGGLSPLGVTGRKRHQMRIYHLQVIGE